MPKAPESSEELYIYPAIFTYDDNVVIIEFPDIPGCISQAYDDKEAVYNAKDVLSLMLYSMEEDNEPLPAASDISALKLKKNQKAFPIDVWMPYYRAQIKTHCVKKTLTIPNWLNVLAEEHNVNFSRMLRKALVEYLGVKDTDD